MKTSRMLIQAAIAAGTTLAACAPVLSVAASHASFRNGTSIYGEPSTAGSVDRVVDVTQVRSINATYGETIAFIQGDQRFVWTFNGLDGRRVALAEIAPSGFNGSTRVYLGRNPAARN